MPAMSGSVNRRAVLRTAATGLSRQRIVIRDRSETEECTLKC